VKRCYREWVTGINRPKLESGHSKPSNSGLNIPGTSSPSVLNAFIRNIEVSNNKFCEN
jgi:hypothetical protein